MIGIDFAEIFRDFPPEVGTALIAMLPIAELRGAIPIAIFEFDLVWWKAALFAIFGNLIPVVFIVFLIDPISHFLRKRIVFFDRFFTWLFDRTQKKFYDKHKKFGDFALILFVAIPLPVTGAWTGSLAAFLFGIPAKKALPFITIGVIIAAVIVTVLSMGVFTIF